jgi:hypothetical protein
MKQKGLKTGPGVDNPFINNNMIAPIDKDMAPSLHSSRRSDNSIP